MDDRPEGLHALDELAALSGVPERTIRFYRQSGLIAAPERRGRRAFYPAATVERLRVIAELRHRGLGLDAIAAVLDDPSSARDELTRVLQIGDELRKPWIEDRAASLSRLEVLETLGQDDDAVLPLLEEHTIIHPLDGPPARTYHVPSVATLELAGDLLSAGITPALAYTSWEALQRHLGALAEELVRLFTTPDGGGVGGGLTVEELMDGFDELRPIALRAVQLVFARAIEQALEEFVASGGVLSVRALPPAVGPDGERLSRPRP